jgi:hypothetical protein
MRIQLHIITLLTSLLLWSVAFQGTRDAYRAAHTAGFIPNLELKHRLNGFI